VLLLSLITLFAGPLMFQWLSRSHRVARILDRVIVVALIGLVALSLVPEIVESLGWTAPVLVLAGYLLPGMLERLVKQAAETLHLLTLYVALAGLLLHEGLDGAGLAVSALSENPGFAWAIVLHRFGMGLMLWLIVQPVFGNAKAWLLLLVMAGATVLGYEFSERLLPLAGDRFIASMQGLIIGTIVHSLVFRGHVRRQPPGT
jgi:hypothetical protein